MQIFFLLTGVLIILLAVFAHLAGIDNNAQWGTSRYVLFFLGLSISAGALLPRLLRGTPFAQSLVRIKERAVAPVRALAKPIRVITSSSKASVVAAVGLLMLVSLFAALYTSQGHFPFFRDSYNPYVELGEAFLHGQVALLEPPDPRLVAMADPVNDLAGREGIPYRYDVSYFQGRYYAYWGPVPGLLNASIQGITGEKPPGALAALIFYVGTGLALLAALLLLRGWRFPRAPGISIALFLLTGLLNPPYMFMLSRSSVYETAILAGQCFLVAGLAGWLAYLRSRRPGWLILIGSCWALAVGSRYNLLLAVTVSAAFALWEFQEARSFSREWFRRALLLGAPLAVMAAALLLYNYARFDNPFETGLRFQLANPAYQQEYYSARFAPSNLYVYLFHPAATRASFPFILPQEIQPVTFPDWARMVPGRDSERAMMGLVKWTPVFWILAVLVPGLLLQPRRRETDPEAASRTRMAGSGQRFFLMLLLAGVLEAAHMMLYYYGAMRFMADCYLLFLLAVAFLAGRLDDQLARAGTRSARTFRASFWGIFTLLAIATALIGFFASFEIPPQALRLNNPDLYTQIAQPFNHLSNEIQQAYLRLLDNPTIVGSVFRALLKTFQ